jgi:glycogen debranching enzyme
MLFVHLTNPALEKEGADPLQQGVLHLLRTQVLWRGALCDRLRIHNYGGEPVHFTLHVAFGADFADIFEARGMKRDRRGALLQPRIERQAVVLGYSGLDGRRRRSRIDFDTLPQSLSAGEATFAIDLPPHEACCLRWTVGCAADEGAEAPAVAADPSAPQPAPWYEFAMERRRAEIAEARGAEPVLSTSNTQFDEWLDRSLADLHMLATDTPLGRYPYAGVPWFSTPFGRDGIITALQCLWLAPEMARGVLCYLASMQADVESDAQDAQPGKILHETRGGEMAAIGEVPFGRYYGSIDSTPLFLMLGGAYLQRSADVEQIRTLWPHFERALEWMDRHGDCDGDGFIEYARQTDRGLSNQGWKDSHDAVFHADGAMAEAPIALCEVQGYVFAARRAAALMARSLGMEERARQLDDQAEALRQRFEATFWCEDLGTYALALDGRKRPCHVPSSNAGQVLYTGIASPERAKRVGEALMSETGFSGWGVRTIASTASRYNPMSYHNGSVWPHDNSLVAAGLARYGMRGHAARILGGLFDASLHFDLHRLPELFCGFVRHPGESPTLYPQACSPQAWAAAAPLLCIQACLGLEVNGLEGRVCLVNPVMPAFLDQLRIRGIRLPKGQMDIVVTRHEADVGVRLMRREGEAELVVQM